MEKSRQAVQERILLPGARDANATDWTGDKNGRVYLGDIYRIVKPTYVCLSWKRKERRARVGDTLREGIAARDRVQGIQRAWRSCPRISGSTPTWQTSPPRRAIYSSFDLTATRRAPGNLMADV